MASFYGSQSSFYGGTTQWLALEELRDFYPEAGASNSCTGSAAPPNNHSGAPPSGGRPSVPLLAPAIGSQASPEVQYTLGQSLSNTVNGYDGTSARRSGVTSAAPAVAGPSFYYAKAAGAPGGVLGRPPRPQGEGRREEVGSRAGRPSAEEAAERQASEDAHPGSAISILPGRAERSAECRGLDKDIASCQTAVDVLAVASQHAGHMDGPNWANMVYALAHHFKKRTHGGSGNADWFRDPCWDKGCIALRGLLGDLTARDLANVLWSLATLQKKEAPLFLEAADALCSKLAVVDPVSVSKAAWALTAVPNRDRRLKFFNHLAVPVVLRAEAFSAGELTMTIYAFAKAEHRDADVYESFSDAVRRLKEEMRPVEVCNVIWAFCTVGFRDDVLFSGLCDTYLTKPEVVAHYNPQDLSNIMWGFSKVLFVHTLAMDTLALEAVRQRNAFKPIQFSNTIYAFATLRLRGPPGFLQQIQDAALEKASQFDSGNYSVACWALAQLSDNHALVDRCLQHVQTMHGFSALNSRTLSMLFLAFYTLGRVADVDTIFDCARKHGLPIGSSGYSCICMSAEHGDDAEREVRILQIMAAEAKDDHMYAAIVNGAAIRLAKRGRPEAGRQLLVDMRSTRPQRWSIVSEALLSRLSNGSALLEHTEWKEEWGGPVVSGIHPIAATRQNEGSHAYTREFMTLQSVLCSPHKGDVDACMATVEQFAESRSLWLKITAWEKALVVYECAKLAKAKLVVEIGAYVGYSAMNLARAVRPHGGRVASIEVDPMHVSVVRNMLEFAGVSDVVDSWTGYCGDVIPLLINQYGPKSVDMVFMDQKGTRFHTDLELLRTHDLLADGAVILADNVLKPGAPLYIWHLGHGPYRHLTAVSVREFLLQSEDWMVMGFYDAAGGPVQTPPLGLNRLSFESDAFRKKSMFDAVAPSKSEWWKFSSDFVSGLERCGAKPKVVGIHGRDNPVLKPEDIRGIFERAGRLPPAPSANTGAVDSFGGKAP